MLVPGSSVVSPAVTLLKAAYENAWFFEGGEEDSMWTGYEGLGPEFIGTPGGGSGGGGAVSAIDDVRCDKGTGYAAWCTD